jgi:hypothetical protein
VVARAAVARGAVGGAEWDAARGALAADVAVGVTDGGAVAAVAAGGAGIESGMAVTTGGGGAPEGG